MNNPMPITSGTNPVAQYIQSHINEKVAQTPSYLNYFLTKIIDIITRDFMKKNKDDDYKKFTIGFTFNLLHEIQKTHIRNNSYHIPNRIEFEYSNKKIILENNDTNTKEKKFTELTIATQQGETCGNTISTEAFSQFCRIQLAIERNILTEEEISYTAEGKPDYSKMDVATGSLLTYILSDVVALESALQNDAPEHIQPTSSGHTTPLSENCHPVPSPALKRNTSFLYRQLSRKTPQDNSTINRGDDALTKTVYTPKQKYLEDTIGKIVENLKKSYSKDSAQIRSIECDGLFRLSGDKNENDTALANLEECSLDIDKTHRDTLVHVVKHNFSKINPVDKEVLSQMIENPNKAAEILNNRINTMKANEKKLFLIILEFYSDAYQSADDSTNSKFNKEQLLTASLRPTILPNLYDCFEETPLDRYLIEKRSQIGDEIVLNIFTSLSYENGSLQLKTDHQERAHSV